MTLKTSEQHLGKSIIHYFSGERTGKRKALWKKENLLET
jgi:hypothetical protein